MNSSLKLIRLSSRPFSISQKHYIKNSGGILLLKNFPTTILSVTLQIHIQIFHKKWKIFKFHFLRKTV
eukprot:UN23064